MNNGQNDNVIKPGENNGVVTPTTPTTTGVPVTPMATNNVKNKVNINKKIIIIVAAVLVVIFLIYNMFIKGTVTFNVGIGKNANKEEEKIQLKLKDDWANNYALAVQDVFKETTTFDLAFYDLNFDTNPEAIVSFKEKDEDSMIVYFMDRVTGNVSNSKKFTKASMNILHSLEDGESYWYLKIVKRDNYVTYTKLSKVIDGTVTAPDIDCTSDKLLNEFKNKYVISDFNPVFYSINKSSFEKDFTTIYERYSDYDKKVYNEVDKLKEKYKDSKIEKEVDNNPFFTLGDYRISYATFTGKKYTVVDDEKKEETITLEIKNDGTLTLEGKDYKFTTVNNIINIENGKTLTASQDNVLTYNDYNGVIFTTDAQLPEKEKPSITGNNNQNNQNDQNDQDDQNDN